MPLGGTVGHYENFPVASWLCPAHLRAAVAAIYHFARTADDIADEGDSPAETRLADLAAYREALQHTLDGRPAPRWSALFFALGRAIRAHDLPAAPLHDLISAFEQDVRHTAAGHVYADLPELLAYCRLSANPVGRLLLHLWGVRGEDALRESDAICSALQLINFWQDIGRDLPRGRWYLPRDALARHGLTPERFVAGDPADDAARVALVTELCAHARGLMQMGEPLVHRVGGRAGWELRLVVQGGLGVLDAIAGIGHRSWAQRVALSRRDAPRLAWRALWM